MNIPFFVFQFVVLIFSAVIHEVSHGYIAEKLGDPTARLAGRITLNPLAHVSLFGMVIMPLLTYFAWGIPVGGAKPVPYNPYNLKDSRRGGGLIALSGPMSNFLIAIVFGIIIRFSIATGVFSESVVELFTMIIYINLFLGLFNLVPIPPLDGSKVIYLVLPRMVAAALEGFVYNASVLIRQNWVIFLVLFFLFFQYVLRALFTIINPILNFFLFLLTGVRF